MPDITTPEGREELRRLDNAARTEVWECLQAALRQAQQSLLIAARDTHLALTGQAEIEAERDAAIERERRTQHWLDEFQSALAGETLRAEAAEQDAEEQRALAEVRGSALVLASANIRQDAWDKMSIPARVRITEALPAEALRAEHRSDKDRTPSTESPQSGQEEGD